MVTNKTIGEILDMVEHLEKQITELKKLVESKYWFQINSVKFKKEK